MQEGQILAEKYRIDRVLGAGAMGVVVAAHHLGLDAKVAIKFLLPEMLGDEQAVSRFAREARAAARIKSEHVTRVLDVGMLETGAPYMVMEYLEGTNLQDWLTRLGPMSVPQAVSFILQACEAIAEAHDLGIVHRDLKPANLFCVKRPNGSPCIKVLDFGISKMSSAGGSGQSVAMTRTSTTMGTPLYMSPEQMESARQADGRSDIWSLGVVLFELLTSKLPFPGETLPEVCLKITTHPAPPVRSVRPDVPAPIEAAILKCLEKDRTRRFQKVDEFCAAIAAFDPAPASAQAAARMHRTLQAPEGFETLMAPDSLTEQGTRSASLESVRGLGRSVIGRSRRRAGVALVVGGTATLVAVVGALAISRNENAGVAPPAPAAAAATAAPIAKPPAIPPPAEAVAEPQAPEAGVSTEAPTAPPTAKPAPKPARPVVQAAPKPASRTPTTNAPAPQAPAAPELPKGSSAYDERL